MNDDIKKVAKILRVQPEVIERLMRDMEAITHREGVLEDLLEENASTIKETLGILRISSLHAEDIANAIENLLQHDDRILFDILGKPDLLQPETTKGLIKASYDAVGGNPASFFLKKEKARQMLLKTPPPAIMRGLGYTTVAELLEKERLEEIFAALRFIETREWMNNVFVREYEALTPKDFEERPLELLVLPEKWLSLAEKFLEKKYHNVSHLKELGVVFVIPIKLDIAGEILRLFSLILHYLYEVPFYAKLTKAYAKNPDSFSQKLMSLIRGDVGEIPKASTNGFVRWLIIQRYLAKGDELDERLFVPHVNPEAIHWGNAQKALADYGSKHPELRLNLFRNLDYVGDFFPSRKIGELLVSFDLVDNVMGLVKRETLIKYLYHQQEALWNRIFSGFMGSERMEELILEHLDKGYIELAP